MPQPSTSLPGRLKRLVPAAALAFLLLTLVVWAAVYFWADDAPLPTLYVFGPRWPLALPLAALVPLVAWARSWRGAALVLAAGVVVAGPLAGLRVRVGAVGADPPARARVRVVTWNALGQGGPAMKLFVERTQPDLVVCQELRLEAADLPDGYTIPPECPNVASRLPIRSAGGFNFWQTGLGGRLDKFVLAVPGGEVTLVNVHLPTVRSGIEAFIGTKGRNWSELRHIIAARDEASRAARAWAGDAPNAILTGDFNMPVESRIYRRDWGGFRNAFDEAGTGWGTTKQTRWHGVRIDHILYTPQWRCRRVWVGPAMGSDHRPVVADLALEG